MLRPLKIALFLGLKLCLQTNYELTLNGNKSGKVVEERLVGDCFESVLSYISFCSFTTKAGIGGINGKTATMLHI